ncbi:hypothetical protein DL93DRAFT_2063974 [Clavulina sp. PMI_390]|nr:hypothetical protein DL93DRAFT_2063974 [Clavulina sp. PMI_390]
MAPAPNSSLLFDHRSTSSIEKRDAYEVEDWFTGDTFFDGWTFFDQRDPTNGAVNYVNQSAASALNLAYTNSDGRVIMQVDNTNDLPYGALRNSVRISTAKSYNSGLFVLDAIRFPYGCAVWPAWWMLGPNWPSHGEIDIFEGINLNTQNQYTAHTAANCHINQSPSDPSFAVSTSSSFMARDDCGPSPDNAGCEFIDQNNHGPSFGEGLNGAGGAVLVMEWKDEGIRIWNFPRYQVPSDLNPSFGFAASPNPDRWDPSFLKAAWESSTCPTSTYFGEMSMVFDITLCGDWAGSSKWYGSSGCPGTCKQQVMKGSNFANAVWEINYVAVYQRTQGGY